MTLRRSTLDARIAAASALLNAGCFNEAALLCEGLVADCEQTPGLGPKHPHTLELRRRRADALSAAGYHEEALDSLRQLVADCEQTPGLGPKHPCTLDFRNDLLFALRNEGYVSRRRPDRYLAATGTTPVSGASTSPIGKETSEMATTRSRSG